MSAGGADWASAGALEDGAGNTFDLSTTVAGATQPYWPAWWVWTAPVDAVVQLDTFASVDGGSGDTILTVFTGADEGSEVEVASNDDAAFGVLLSALTFRATSGTTYHIRVGTFDSDADTITGYVLTTALNAYEDLPPISGSEEVVAPGLGGPVYPFPTSPIVGGPGCLTDADDATYLDLTVDHEDGVDPAASGGYAHLPTATQTPIGLLWSMRAAAVVDGANAFHPFDSHDGVVIQPDMSGDAVLGGITGGADTFDDDQNLATYATLVNSNVSAPTDPFPVAQTEWLKMAFNPTVGATGVDRVTFRAAVIPTGTWDPTGTFLSFYIGDETYSTVFGPVVLAGTGLPVDGSVYEFLDPTGVGIAWPPLLDPGSIGLDGLLASGTAYLYVSASGWADPFPPPDAAVRIYDVAVGLVDTGNAGPPVAQLDIVSRDGDGPPPEYAASFDYGVDVELTADGTFYDYTGDFADVVRNPGTLTLDDVYAFVAGGAYVGVTPNGDGGTNSGPWQLEVQVAELLITALFPLGAVTFVPPLRQHPRSDGLGTSSAPRMFPLAPSIQASNRRAGGYL